MLTHFLSFKGDLITKIISIDSKKTLYTRYRKGFIELKIVALIFFEASEMKKKLCLIATVHNFMLI